MSLGVYNTDTGAGADIGFTFDNAAYLRDNTTQRWGAYANSEAGWRSSDLMVDAAVHACVRVTLFPSSTSAMTLVVDGVGQAVFDKLDPQLRLNTEGVDLGYYRFDSIAQNPPETLRGGAQLLNSTWSDWVFWDVEHRLFPATRERVADVVHGYLAGPCCTDAEKSKIYVAREVEWTESQVSIDYALEGQH